MSADLPPLMMASFCVQPLEVAYVANLDTPHLDEMFKTGPGCSLLVSVIANTAVGIADGTFCVDMPRDMAVLLRDALNAWVEDGHHTHADVDQKTLVRMADHGLAGGGADADVEFVIPDTLEALEGGARGSGSHSAPRFRSLARS